MASSVPDQALAYMTGQSSGLAQPAAIGQKFTSLGAVLPFAGNTFICPIPPASAAHRAFCDIQDMLRDGAPAGAYTYLPPSSLHMTVFEGVCDAYRAPGFWPAHLDTACPVETVTRDFAHRFAALDLPQRFNIAPFEVFAGMSIFVQGSTTTDTAALRTTRTLLRRSTGLNQPAFAGYQFHVTLAYLTRWLSPDEAGVMQTLSDQALAHLLRDAPTITLGPVCLCSFDDMHAFTPVAL
jgi:hypothetical protein